MNNLEVALLEVVGFLEARRTRYMVVGGFAALLAWVVKDARFDLTVEVSDPALAGFIEATAREFRLSEREPFEFAIRNHLIRLMTRGSVPVDLMLGVLPYQSAAIARAVEVPVGPRTVRFCTPEDLIIYKLASERPQDHIDVEGVVLRQAGALDRTYLEPHLYDLAAGLERPEILTIYSGALKKAGLPELGPCKGTA